MGQNMMGFGFKMMGCCTKMQQDKRMMFEMKEGLIKVALKRDYAALSVEERQELEHVRDFV